MFDLMAHRKGAVNHVPSFIRSTGQSVKCASRESPIAHRMEVCTNCSRSSGAAIFFRPTSRALARPMICRQLISDGMSPRQCTFPNFCTDGLGISDGIQDVEILGRQSHGTNSRGVRHQRHADRTATTGQLRAWLEGADKSMMMFCRGSVQRGNGRNERPVPASHRRSACLHGEQERAERYFPKRCHGRAQSGL